MSDRITKVRKNTETSSLQNRMLYAVHKCTTLQNLMTNNLKSYLSRCGGLTILIHILTLTHTLTHARNRVQGMKMKSYSLPH